MCSDKKVKITVTANRPSEQALRNFQKKLYQLLKSNEPGILARSAHDKTFKY